MREFSMNSKCRCILFSQHFYFFLSLPRMINDNIFLRHGKINLLSSIKLMFEGRRSRKSKTRNGFFGVK